VAANYLVLVAEVLPLTHGNLPYEHNLPIGRHLTEKALRLLGNGVRLGCGFAILLSAFVMI